MSLSSGGFDTTLQGEQFVQFRDGKLNTAIELALLHGIYTGIVSVALWNIFNNKFRSIGQVGMVASIISLYIATTINFSLNWESRHDVIVAFKIFFSVSGTGKIHAIYEELEVRTSEVPGIDITVAVSTVIADSIMIWRCWIVWGRRWLVVLVPILCLISGFVCQIWVIVFRLYIPVVSRSDKLYKSLLVTYISCILATTLWCTILIVIRILTVTRGVNSRLGDYHHIIEVLVESSALHSVALIIYIALEASNNVASVYIDTLAAITMGVTPTVLAGRVAAGHARPDDSWEGGIISSLRFEAHPQADAETCSQFDSLVDNDLEALSIQVDEPEETRAEKSI
ncbi:hypothetical protein ARMGADRAFT_1059233 [Armillaria gallica]|uniref:Uncharacterized protein n=1 Tax=Armillaria gallica TaxID=47427 RepID=A0A2H3EER1_ARMGA|nr:hypothetical protein ARMGADRAFT_1059233 [Armillaria gallica]